MSFLIQDKNWILISTGREQLKTIKLYQKKSQKINQVRKSVLAYVSMTYEFQVI